MARLIRHDATGPRKLDAADLDDEKGNIAICQCGLSAEYPFCDGSHRATDDENQESLYRYEDDDDEGERRVVDRLVYDQTDSDARE